MDTDTTVRTLLELAGVAPPEDEVLELIAGYPASRAAMDAIYAVADLPATDGILTFNAVS
jgi:hypothetical protein